MSAPLDASRPGGFSHEMFLVALGECVRRRRKKEHWSQRELAERSQLSKSEIQHVESGRRDLTLGTVFRVSGAFGICFLELLAEALWLVVGWRWMRR